MIRYYADDFVELWQGDIRDGFPPSVEPGSVACAVTSPPYNVGLDYDVHDDSMSWADYQCFAGGVCAELNRVLCDTGRVWVNAVGFVPVANTIRAASLEPVPRVGLASLWDSELRFERFEIRDWVAWTSNREPDTAWGSWESPSAPNLRGGWEAIIAASKGPWRREQPDGFYGWRDTIGGWAALTSNVWRIMPQRRERHPAPFPLEVPRRCIRLSTWPGELVVDPFAGTGTTLLAARQLGRRAVGVELSEDYCEQAMWRLAQGNLEFGGAA